MKQAKLGRRPISSLKKAERDFRIIATYDYYRRGNLGSALDHYKGERIREAFSQLRADGISPRKAEKFIAKTMAVDIGCVQRALKRKRTPATVARNKAAAETLTSPAEVARVLADRARDTGEFLPDD